MLRPSVTAPLPDLLAAAAHANTADLYFLPHLLGERSPHWNASARGAFLGLARHHGPAELTRAVLEGVAFNLATCVSAFREAELAVDRVDAIGGGAVSDLCAAVTTAVAVGLVPGFAVARDLSQVSAEFTPDPGHADYTHRHARVTDAYRRLEPWFADNG